MAAKKAGSRKASGSVRGLTAEAADKMLASLVRSLQRDSGDGRTFAMKDAVAKLREAKMSESMVEGFKFALMRMPGMQKGKRDGVYRLPVFGVAHARHRSWRMALGRADLADAVALQNALRKIPPRDLTPNLTRLLDRLEGATLPLLREDDA